jgi:hypothetical protein
MLGLDKNGDFSPRSGVVSFLDILGTKSVSSDTEAREFLTNVNQLYDDFELLKDAMNLMMSQVKNINLK